MTDFIKRGPYDPTKHLVHNLADLSRRLEALHPHAEVAWDRDTVRELTSVIVVAPADKSQSGPDILGYAVDNGRRIFRLILDKANPLGIRWYEFDRKARPERRKIAR